MTLSLDRLLASTLVTSVDFRFGREKKGELGMEEQVSGQLMIWPVNGLSCVTLCIGMVEWFLRRDIADAEKSPPLPF